MCSLVSLVAKYRISVEMRNASGRRGLGAARVKELARAVLEATKSEPGEYQLSLLLTGDRQMRRLNKRHLGRNSSTDVLAFPGEDDFLGDVAICLDRAVAQAKEYGWRARNEVELLLVHGVLHLLGHDHETDGGEMAALQEEIAAAEIKGER